MKLDLIALIIGIHFLDGHALVGDQTSLCIVVIAKLANPPLILALIIAFIMIFWTRKAFAWYNRHLLLLISEKQLGFQIILNTVSFLISVTERRLDSRNQRLICYFIKLEIQSACIISFLTDYWRIVVIVGICSVGMNVSVPNMGALRDDALVLFVLCRVILAQKTLLNVLLSAKWVLLLS